ncbi:MAG: DUF4968 domain-containing protein, partial [Candidatus Lokiarchaeota archaeon]|nr:DUF4968 domain-containing protein [Candidatus Lokiarchaeota archaeon]
MNSLQKYTTIGDVKKAKRIETGIELRLEKGLASIHVFAENLIRIRITFTDNLNEDFSYAVIKPLDKWSKIPFNIDENETEIILKTESLIMTISKKPFKLIVVERKNPKNSLFKDYVKGHNSFGACIHRKNNVRSYKIIDPDTHFYGFGEKTGPLDKMGQKMVMNAVDMPYSGDKDPLYQSHPFFISIRNDTAHAIFFDNISKTTFDMGNSNENYYYFDAKEGELNYYLIYGPDIDNILRTYTELTGRMELPPKWAIGYHQCRYSYKNEKEVREICKKFRENNVGCDGIWFDIHYMDGYRCFTFNKKRFPDPKGLLGELKQDGFHPIVIVDPGIKVDKDYKIYQELIENEYFTKNKEGKPSKGWVWPGLTNFPDFTLEKVRKWWADKHKFYFDLGVEGIWIDMNEPALSINPLLSLPLRIHDMYLDNQGQNTPIQN